MSEIDVTNKYDRGGIGRGSKWESVCLLLKKTFESKRKQEKEKLVAPLMEFEEVWRDGVLWFDWDIWKGLCNTIGGHNSKPT